MNPTKLKKEGEKWVKEGIITDEQLEAILASYAKKDQSYILVLFAALLMSIGILIFIFSDWAQVPHVSRLLIMVAVMLVLYFLGHHYFMQHTVNELAKQSTSHTKHGDKRLRVYGVTFIILGYIFFGATLLLILNMYNVTLLSVWPFIIWSIVGLLLYVLYEHPFIYVVGIVINIFSQVYSGLALSSFSYIIFLILLIGYFHYAYHRDNVLFSYLFAIGLSIQFLVSSIVGIEQYYWFMFFILLMYALGEALQKTIIKRAFTQISLVTIFIFKMYESFLLQENYFLAELETQGWFFVVLGIVWLAVLVSKWRHHTHLEAVDLLLFVPFFFLPYAYIFVIISMFVFALYWLVIGFQRHMDDKIIIGITSFIASTFIVYIQYAWETLNKSLFFLIGGVLLFGLSIFLERKRRKNESTRKGGDVK